MWALLKFGHNNFFPYLRVLDSIQSRIVVTLPNTSGYSAYPHAPVKETIPSSVGIFLGSFGSI